MKYIQLFFVVLTCSFADNRLPVTITPRDGLFPTKSAPFDSSGIRAQLIAPCGDIYAIRGPQGKNITVCQHGDAIAVLYGAATGSSNDPMAVKIAYSTNQGAAWQTYGPFTGNIRRMYGGCDGTPDFCANPGACVFCYMKGAYNYDPFPLEVIIEENLPGAPSPSAPVNVTWSDSLYPWFTGICMAPDNPAYIITHGWSYLSAGDSSLYCWYSADGGYSWSEPIDMGVDINPGYGGNCGPKLRMGTAGYVAGIFNNSIGGLIQDVWPHFIESTNGGQTWLPPVPLPVPHFDSSSGKFCKFNIEAEIINDKPWLIANDVGGGGFWLFKGNGSPSNWTWTAWDLNVIGACSTWVADTLFQMIPDQYGSICYEPISGLILVTYKGLARIEVGGNVYAEGPAVCGVYTRNNGSSWHICSPLSVWNTMNYSDWDATETAHRIVNIGGHLYAYSIWIHNINYNLYFEGGTTNNGNIGGNINEIVDIQRYDYSLRISPTICSQRCQARFELPERQDITLKIYDRAGRLVDLLYDRQAAAGEHKLSLNLGTYPAGVYFIALETKTGVQTAKVIVSR